MCFHLDLHACFMISCNNMQAYAQVLCSTVTAVQSVLYSLTDMNSKSCKLLACVMQRAGTLDNHFCHHNAHQCRACTQYCQIADYCAHPGGGGEP